MELKNLIYGELQKLDILKNVDNLFDLLTYSPDANNGDVTLPCFSLAKTLHVSPIQIGDDIVKNFHLRY